MANAKRAAVSPVKNAGAAKAKGSPGKGFVLSGRRNKDDIKTSKLPAGWHIRSVLVVGLMELIFITTSSLEDDAFTNNMVTVLDDASTPSSHPLKAIGLVGAFFMRVSLADDSPLCNRRNTHHRKAYLRVLDPGQDTDESRFASLQVIKTFLEAPENNKYSTAVHLSRSGWNLNVPDQPLPRLDSYLRCADIKAVIESLFTDHGPGWATADMDRALSIFTEGYIPFAAVADLGFPLDMVNVGPALEPGLEGQNGSS